MVGLKSEELRSKFLTSILESCSSIVPCHFKPIRFLQQKSASAGFSCPLIPQKKTKEDDIKKQKPTANTEEVSIDAAAAAEPSRRHVLLTWPLPPTGSRELSQPVSTRLHYRNSIGLLECNSLASPCQIPSFFFFLYQMSTRDKSKRFRKRSSEAGPFFVRSKVSSSEYA